MDNKNNMNPVKAGLTGFILGVVGTAAIAMSDKNTRAKVTKKANVMKDSLEKWSKDTLHEFKTTGDDVKTRAAEKNDDLKTEAASLADELDEERKTL